MIGEGKSYWIYRYRFGGKEREASLGPFSELTLAEAREKHAAMRKSVVVDKTDPLAEKRRTKTVQGARPSRPSATWPTTTSRRTKPHGAMPSIAGSGDRR